VLRELAKEKGHIGAAIAAEVKRGELRRFYVKQVERGPRPRYTAASSWKPSFHASNPDRSSHLGDAIRAELNLAALGPALHYDQGPVRGQGARN
jgi:hypothetical protein